MRGHTAGGLSRLQRGLEPKSGPRKETPALTRGASLAAERRGCPAVCGASSQGVERPATGGLPCAADGRAGSDPQVGAPDAGGNSRAVGAETRHRAAAPLGALQRRPRTCLLLSAPSSSLSPQGAGKGPQVQQPVHRAGATEAREACHWGTEEEPTAMQPRWDPGPSPEPTTPWVLATTAARAATVTSRGGPSCSPRSRRPSNKQSPALASHSGASATPAPLCTETLDNLPAVEVSRPPCLPPTCPHRGTKHAAFPSALSGPGAPGDGSIPCSPLPSLAPSPALSCPPLHLPPPGVAVPLLCSQPRKYQKTRPHSRAVSQDTRIVGRLTWGFRLQPPTGQQSLTKEVVKLRFLHQQD